MNIQTNKPKEKLLYIPYQGIENPHCIYPSNRPSTPLSSIQHRINFIGSKYPNKKNLPQIPKFSLKTDSVGYTNTNTLLTGSKSAITRGFSFCIFLKGLTQLWLQKNFSTYIDLSDKKLMVTNKQKR